MIRSESLPHGLLLLGAEGVGKTALTRRLALSLFCSEHRSDLESCGQCDGCRQVISGVHPELSVLAPEPDKKTIQIDAVREFSRQLHLTSRQGQQRLGIVSPAEALTISAANALLKTLEEPPVGVTIVLLAAQISRLPATIRSRCQIVRLASPDPAQGVAWLKTQGVTLPEEQIRAMLTSQGPYRVLSLMTQEEPAAFQAELEALQRELGSLAQGQADCVAIARDWCAAGLHLIAGWLYMVAMQELAQRQGVEPTQQQEAQRPLARMSLTSLLDLPGQCTQLQRDVQTQLNPQSLAESLLIRLRAELQ